VIIGLLVILALAIIGLIIYSLVGGGFPPSSGKLGGDKGLRPPR